MKRNHTNQGFTLIELIMVIVILGILSAVIVPRFFDISTKAHEANEKASIGTIESALSMYSAKALVNNGHKAYPDGDWIESDGDFHRLLEKTPENWSVASSGSTSDHAVKFVYSGVTPNVTYLYTCPVSGDSTKYTLVKQ